VTNNHVVEGDVRTVNISLGDRREMPATVVGTDPMTDIALLKVEARSLPTVPWGDSSRLKVGEWVLAIGSPFQLSQTVTLGIVSAVGRANVGFTQYEDFIQTDAAINPGNSGGALVSARGELVGINTGILSRSGGYQGIGFAVPSNLARRVIDDLKQFGEVRRGSIGAIELASITTRLARRARLAHGSVVTGLPRRPSARRRHQGIRRSAGRGRVTRVAPRVRLQDREPRPFQRDARWKDAGASGIDCPGLAAPLAPPPFRSSGSSRLTTVRPGPVGTFDRTG
jgi:serine protease Do